MYQFGPPGLPGRVSPLSTETKHKLFGEGLAKLSIAARATDLGANQIHGPPAILKTFFARMFRLWTNLESFVNFVTVFVSGLVLKRGALGGEGAGGADLSGSRTIQYDRGDGN